MFQVARYFSNCSNFYALFIFINYCAAQHKQFCPFQKRVEPLPFQEQNAADACKPNPTKCDPNDVYYSIDGSCNNIEFPMWGQAGVAFTRILPANYSDGISKLRTSIFGEPLPLARVLRTLLLPNVETIRATSINILFYGFGQFFDHDVSHQQPMTSTENCCINGKPAPAMNENVCLPTVIPPNDPFYSKYGVECLDLNRAITTQTLGCSIKPVTPINFQTAFIDASFVYGADSQTLSKLRLYKGGLLKVSAGDLPPISPSCPEGGITPEPGAPCFEGGDSRLNQNPELFAIGVSCLRYHNYLATELKLMHPYATDQQLFDEARRILIAVYQHIVFSEYVPTLVGPATAALYNLYPKTIGYVNEYNSRLNPQTLESYSSASGRSGHSTVLGMVGYKDSSMKTVSYRLRDKYFNMGFFQQKNIFFNIITAYASQVCQQQDQWFTEEVNNYLFDSVDAPYGQDLSSIDINRGRDFGLQPYNKFREACGLCRLNKFEDMASEIKDPFDVKKLQQVYRSIDDIDVYIGGLLEKPLPGGTVGPTFACLLGEAFFRWKFGDRIYYEFPQAKFTIPQLGTIRKTSTFSQILCTTNPELKEIQVKSFLVPSPQNPVVPCSKIPKINLTFWKGVLGIS